MELLIAGTYEGGPSRFRAWDVLDSVGGTSWQAMEIPGGGVVVRALRDHLGLPSESYVVLYPGDHITASWSSQELTSISDALTVAQYIATEVM